MRYDIEKLLDKYWNGESSIQEEQEIRSYLLSDSVDEDHREFIPLFQYFESESKVGSEFELDLSFTQSQKTKVRFLFPKLIAIAASLVLLFSVSRQWVNSSTDTIYKNKYTELQDPNEALQITLDALGFVSHNIEKGTREVSHLKKFEKTAVFNFDK